MWQKATRNGLAVSRGATGGRSNALTGATAWRENQPKPVFQTVENEEDEDKDGQ